MLQEKNISIQYYSWKFFKRSQEKLQFKKKKKQKQINIKTNMILLRLFFRNISVNNGIMLNLNFNCKNECIED